MTSCKSLQYSSLYVEAGHKSQTTRKRDTVRISVEIGAPSRRRSGFAGVGVASSRTSFSAIEIASTTAKPAFARLNACHEISTEIGTLPKTSGAPMRSE